MGCEPCREPTYVTKILPTAGKTQLGYEGAKMKFAFLALFAGIVVMASVQEASAVVYCVNGVVRAGCVVRRPVVVAPAAVVVAPVVVAPRTVVVAPRRAVRCTIVNGVRVCR